MSNTDRIRAITLATQKRIGRLAKRDFGLTLEDISRESGIPYPTIRNYFSQQKNFKHAELPVSALVKLAGVIPDELLSQLLEPADRHLVLNDDDDAELDDQADVADEYARAVRRARHPKSPGGCEIISIEEEAIKRIGRKLKRSAA